MTTFGGSPKASYKGEGLWQAEGQMKTNAAACNIACLQAETESFVLISKVLAIN